MSSFLGEACRIRSSDISRLPFFFFASALFCLLHVFATMVFLSLGYLRGPLASKLGMK
jgi:hypothetical protein